MYSSGLKVCMIGIKENNLFLLHKITTEDGTVQLANFHLATKYGFSLHQQCIQSFKSSADNLHYHVVIQQASAVDLIMHCV